MYEYYDANTVAEETFAERYENGETQDICACGEMKNADHKFCEICMFNINGIMSEAYDHIKDLLDLGHLEVMEIMQGWIESVE